MKLELTCRARMEVFEFAPTDEVKVYAEYGKGYDENVLDSIFEEDLTDEEKQEGHTVCLRFLINGKREKFDFFYKKNILNFDGEDDVEKIVHKLAKLVSERSNPALKSVTVDLDSVIMVTRRFPCITESHNEALCAGADKAAV